MVSTPATTVQAIRKKSFYHYFNEEYYTSYTIHKSSAMVSTHATQQTKNF